MECPINVHSQIYILHSSLSHYNVISCYNRLYYKNISRRISKAIITAVCYFCLVTVTMVSFYSVKSEIMQRKYWWKHNGNSKKPVDGFRYVNSLAIIKQIMQDFDAFVQDRNIFIVNTLHLWLKSCTKLIQVNNTSVIWISHHNCQGYRLQNISKCFTNVSSHPSCV